MNKIITSLSGLVALIAVEQAQLNYSYAQPKKQASHSSSQRGIESKLLGCLIRADQKTFLETHYQKISPKIKDKEKLKEAYCLFAQSNLPAVASEYHLERAIEKMEEIGADKVDPLVGLMYVYVGKYYEMGYDARRLITPSWFEIYNRSNTFEEVEEGFKIREEQMKLAEWELSEALSAYKKGLDIWLNTDLDKSFREDARFVCQDIINYTTNPKEKEKYQKILSQLK